MSAIGQESVSGLWVTTTTIGETAVQVALSRVCLKGVRVRANGANSGNIFIGPTNKVTDDGTPAATTGYPLDAGEELFLPVDNTDQVWAIADAADQVLHVVAI